MAVQRALRDLGISQRALASRAGMSPSIIIRLKSTGHSSRTARAANVRDIARTLNEMAVERGLDPPFPSDPQVLQLAGLEEPETGDRSVDVRDAIRRSPDFDEAQKRALLGLIDVLDRDRSRRESDRAVESA